ncbi:MAG: DUF4421 family protein [Prevotellaceae bacterium]|nr:DUF4421 family protein [Prevotellaceae bacterium]
MKMRLITTLLLLFLSLNLFAQRKGKLHLELLTADSLRLAMRHAADEGRLLQWGDSLLRSHYAHGDINEKKYRKMMAHLRKIDNHLHQGDSLLAANGRRINYDTLYLAKPQGRWTIKFRTNLSGARMEVKGMNGATPFDGTVRSANRATLSMAVAYRGIAVALALNPAKLAGKNRDNEFNLNAYSNRYGFDVVYLSSATYKGTVSSDGVETPVSKGMVQQKALNINAYYALNGRRFSFPAAFSQSYIQKRSAGSVLLGMSLDGQMTDIDGTIATNNLPVKIKLYEFGIGVGYGYNLVAGRHWLFHLSALPTFDIYTHSHITVGSNRVNMKYTFPSLIITARSAAVYSWHNKFTGLTFVLNASTIGNDNHLQLQRDKWRLRLFYGFRF